MDKSIEITEPLIESKIYLIRGQKVMLDSDLAEMCGVKTKRLKDQVRRNIERLPEDFMFEITKEEKEFLPFVFTEHGVFNAFKRFKK